MKTTAGNFHGALMTAALCDAFAFPFSLAHSTWNILCFESYHAELLQAADASNANSLAMKTLMKTLEHMNDTLLLTTKNIKQLIIHFIH